MSYQSEVLADNPVFYARLDELSGLVITDISTNAHNGTYSAAAALGWNSPILTDASSKAVRGNLGRVTAAAGSPRDLTANFTWECWGYYDLSYITAGSAHIINRRGQWGLSHNCQIGFNSAEIMFDLVLGTGGSETFYRLQKTGLTDGAWYHLVGVRNGTVALLYVNGVLADQDTTLITDAVNYNGSGIDWHFGQSVNTTAFPSAGTDEIALYDTPLSAARVLAHYEAALPILPLRATIIINVGVDLNTDQIVPSDFGFAHNFSDTFGDSPIPIVEEITYKTNVNQSEPDYQQRVNAQPHGAYRTLEYHVSPSSTGGRSRLHGELYTPADYYCVPVWSDAGITTAQASSGASTISLDTIKRDYQVGSYIGACTDLQDPTTYQFFKITVVADTQITIEGTVGTTIPSGSPVFPARVCSISEDNFAFKSFAADHEDAILRFDVLETELSTRRITTYTPATTYLSTEVFTLETAKVSFLDSRPFDVQRRIQTMGRDYQYAVDTGSPQTFPVRFLLTTRSDLSDFYGWLDARQGKQNPLWVSTKEKDLIVTARPAATQLTVSPKTGFSLHHGRRHVEFLLTNGTIVRDRVTAITDNGATETWTFANGTPLLVEIAKVSFLKYCTLASDSVQIRYWKGGASGAVIAESSLSFRELLTSPA